MTHPNEQIIRDGFAAFSAGDQEALRRVIAVDAVWHVPGRNPLAGSYKGIEEILGFFGRTAALSEGTFATDVHDVLGNDEHVFAACTVSGQRGGKSLRDNAVLVFPRPGRQGHRGLGHGRRPVRHRRVLELIPSVAGVGARTG